MPFRARRKVQRLMRDALAITFEHLSVPAHFYALHTFMLSLLIYHFLASFSLLFAAIFTHAMQETNVPTSLFAVLVLVSPILLIAFHQSYAKWRTIPLWAFYGSALISILAHLLLVTTYVSVIVHVRVALAALATAFMLITLCATFLTKLGPDDTDFRDNVVSMTDEPVPHHSAESSHRAEHDNGLREEGSPTPLPVTAAAAPSIAGPGSQRRSAEQVHAAWMVSVACSMLLVDNASVFMLIAGS